MSVVYASYSLRMEGEAKKHSSLLRAVSHGNSQSMSTLTMPMVNDSIDSMRSSAMADVL